MINGGNTYTGATQIDQGTLMIGVNNALPTTTAVRIGTGATAGTLDLNGFDQTIGSLAIQSTSNAVTNSIIVDTGKTLTINGAVTLGIDANASDTNVNATGGGSIIVNSGGANFVIGAATGATNDNRVDADFSGLTNFTANLGAGTFRLGDVNGGTEDNPSTMKLAVNNTITAALIRIGDGAGGGVPTTHTITLGSGTNVLSADTFNIGSAGAAIRSGGAIIFDGADTTGSVTIRATDTVSRATINVINTSGSTGGSMDSTINFAGHTADIFASTLTMASRTQNLGGAAATLTFDQGILDVTTLNMASRTGTGTGGATATVNLGDSVAVGSPTTNIGTLNMAVNTSAGGAVTADLNVTGGTVNVGDGLNTGTAINMANAGAGRTVTSTIDLTGGTLNVTGDIIRAGGAGTENATVTLGGSTLNMSGNSIGTSGQVITFVAESGTLSNLAELNGGGALTKTTSGTLIMSSGNAYTGATNVSDGTLQVGVAGVGATGTGLITAVKTAATYANAAVISGSGSLQGSVVIGDTVTAANKGILAPGDGNTTTSNATLTITAAGGLTVAAGSQTQLGITAASGTDTAFAASGLSASAYLAGLGSISDGSAGTAPAAWFSQPTSGQGDFIKLSSGTGALVLGTNGGTATAGQGIVSIFSNGLDTGTLAAGQIFNLVDWFGTFSGGFSTGVGASAGGVHGDFDLPDISTTTFGWDTSAFTSHGVIAVVVVPEPSRALLMLIGLLALGFRRRRIQD
jgi:autotransporter-associated beta strand protein